ncbi:hypothetical protein MJ923_02110 [Shewanella sp. 3B26]|uniref:Uncharacterized protein n=1 Tax=Shewanella zhuhaiensis TaxID=2919576 RepID=A0AAJ1BFU2_9GAMM|nr:hypothetical protein [Shewanella zhuhaiensis]MCH4293099.1 hypothetical protein [Shewanella zhuhaiensis]
MMVEQKKLLSSVLVLASASAVANTDDLALTEVFKPRCDQVLLDLKAKDEQAIFERFHPMRQSWNEGKSAKKMVARKIADFNVILAPLESFTLDVSNSGVMPLPKELKKLYPNATRMVRIEYSYGVKFVGSYYCDWFESEGNWYFYEI